jgi:hypothetical protein
MVISKNQAFCLHDGRKEGERPRLMSALLPPYLELTDVVARHECLHFLMLFHFVHALKDIIIAVFIIIIIIIII